MYAVGFNFCSTLLFDEEMNNLFWFLASCNVVQDWCCYISYRGVNMYAIYILLGCSLCFNVILVFVAESFYSENLKLRCDLIVKEDEI